MYISHPLPEGLRIVDDAPVPQPSGDALARVRDLWEQELALRPRLFNGRIFSLDRIEGNTAHGFMCEYAWHVAQLREPELSGQLRVRSLAVSGLVVAGGHVIFGLRRQDLAVEPGLWELVPCGTVDDGPRDPDGSISWRGVFLQELREELGLEVPPAAPRPFALIEDTATRIWELGVAVEAKVDHRDVLASFVSNPAPEHTEMAAVPLADVPKFHKTRKKKMVGACPLLLKAYGLLDKQ